MTDAELENELSIEAVKGMQFDCVFEDGKCVSALRVPGTGLGQSLNDDEPEPRITTIDELVNIYGSEISYEDEAFEALFRRLECDE